MLWKVVVLFVLLFEEVYFNSNRTATWLLLMWTKGNFLLNFLSTLLDFVWFCLACRTSVYVCLSSRAPNVSCTPSQHSLYCACARCGCFYRWVIFKRTPPSSGSLLPRFLRKSIWNPLPAGMPRRGALVQSEPTAHTDTLDLLQGRTEAQRERKCKRSIHSALYSPNQNACVFYQCVTWDNAHVLSGVKNPSELYHDEKTKWPVHLFIFIVFISLIHIYGSI